MMYLLMNLSLRIGNLIHGAVLKQEKEPPIVTSSMEEGEKEIILLSQKDPAAFKPLYEKYFRRILVFVLRRVNDKELATDITQQVFLKVLTNIGKFQFRGLPFSSWLYRIAVNECNDNFRKMKRVRWVTLERENIGYLYEELTADTTMEDWEKKIPGILQQLKPNELLLIELRFFEGKPFREIAEILNVSEVNVKTKTYRTLQKMKKLFLT